MNPSCVWRRAAAAFMLLAAFAGDAKSRDAAEAAKSLDGLWSGSWGGGRRNGVVFQPVLAEMLIEGDRAELRGFRNQGRLSGTVRFDVRTKRMRVTPTVDSKDSPKPQAVEFTYGLEGDELTLTDPDDVAVSLRRRHAPRAPLADLQAELATATGINDAGDLLVTGYRVLRARPDGPPYYQPQERKLKMNQATVLLVQDAGLRKLAVNEARERIRQPTPVVIAFRQEERPSPFQASELVQDVGSPAPDSEAVRRTLSQLLRPGTLVFVFPANESVPQP